MIRRLPPRAAWLLAAVVLAACGTAGDATVPAVEVEDLTVETLATVGLTGVPTVHDLTMADGSDVEVSFSCPRAHLVGEPGARRRQVYLGTPTGDWHVMATWEPSSSPSEVAARLDERAACGPFEEEIFNLDIEHTPESATTIDGVRVWTRVVRLAGQLSVVAETVVTSRDGDTVVLHVERPRSTDRGEVAATIVEVVHALER